MTRNDQEIDENLKRQLDVLKPVPPRDLQSAMRGRARFLAEAMSAKNVSADHVQRHIGQSISLRKERFAMNMLVTFALIFALLFGGAAGTVYAAQDTLPTDLLYPVKILSEDVRLGLAVGPQEQAELLEELAQTRVEEIVKLQNRGVESPATVCLRLQQHNWQILSLAAGLDNLAMQAMLERLHTRLQGQYATLNQVDKQSPTLLQTRETLQIQLRLVETGLTDPDGFRYLVRSENQNRIKGVPNLTVSPTGPGSLSDGTPQPGQGGYGPGSPSDGTPQPGQGGYGPGSPSSGTPQPGQDGDGNGKGGSGNH